MTNETTRQTDGRIHHFLLPAERLGRRDRGQGSRELAPERPTC